jgi:hypothetical protein
VEADGLFGGQRGLLHRGPDELVALHRFGEVFHDQHEVRDLIVVTSDPARRGADVDGAGDLGVEAELAEVGAVLERGCLGRRIGGRELPDDGRRSVGLVPLGWKRALRLI